MDPIACIIALISVIALTVYITVLICNHEFNSLWQVIAYTSSEVVVPKEIYICKRCYEKADINYRYCPNCGARMTNGINYNYHSGKIDILS
jgi:uncharacterized paraquat-inducible protein A